MKGKTQGTADREQIIFSTKLREQLQAETVEYIKRTGRIVSWQTYGRLKMAAKPKW